MEEIVKNEFLFYSTLAKPLVLNLPKSRDRILAAAWIKKFADEKSGDEKLRTTYLKLLLFCLQRRQLSGIFSDDPSNYEVLEDLPPDIDLNEFARNLLEQEQVERRELIRSEMMGDIPVFPAFTTDCSPDLTEYVAAQDIPNFGVHAYYAISKQPINKWQRSELAVFPKGTKSSIDTSQTVAPSTPTAPTPKTTASAPEVEQPVTTDADSNAKSTSPEKKKRRPKKLGSSPPTHPIGEVKQPTEDRPTPTWGTNLVKVRDRTDVGHIEEPTDAEKDLEKEVSKLLEQQEADEGDEGVSSGSSKDSVESEAKEMVHVLDEYQHGKMNKSRKKPPSRLSRLGDRTGLKVPKSIRMPPKIPVKGMKKKETADLGHISADLSIGSEGDEIKDLSDDGLQDESPPPEEPFEGFNQIDYDALVREAENELAAWNNVYEEGVLEDEPVVELFEDEIEDIHDIMEISHEAESVRTASPAITRGIPVTTPERSASPKRVKSPEKAYAEDDDYLLKHRQSPLRPPKVPKRKIPIRRIPKSKPQTDKDPNLSMVFEKAEKVVKRKSEGASRDQHEAAGHSSHRNECSPCPRSGAQDSRQYANEDDEFQMYENKFRQESPGLHHAPAQEHPDPEHQRRQIEEKARQQEIMLRMGSPQANEILQDAEHSFEHFQRDGRKHHDHPGRKLPPPSQRQQTPPLGHKHTDDASSPPSPAEESQFPFYPSPREKRKRLPPKTTFPGPPPAATLPSPPYIFPQYSSPHTPIPQRPLRRPKGYISPPPPPEFGPEERPEGYVSPLPPMYGPEERPEHYRSPFVPSPQRHFPDIPYSAGIDEEQPPEFPPSPEPYEGSPSEYARKPSRPRAHPGMFGVEQPCDVCVEPVVLPPPCGPCDSDKTPKRKRPHSRRKGKFPRSQSYSPDDFEEMEKLAEMDQEPGPCEGPPMPEFHHTPGEAQRVRQRAQAQYHLLGQYTPETPEGEPGPSRRPTGQTPPEYNSDFESPPKPAPVVQRFPKAKKRIFRDDRPSHVTPTEQRRMPSPCSRRHDQRPPTGAETPVMRRSYLPRRRMFEEPGDVPKIAEPESPVQYSPFTSPDPGAEIPFEFDPLLEEETPPAEFASPLPRTLRDDQMYFPGECLPCDSPEKLPTVAELKQHRFVPDRMHERISHRTPFGRGPGPDQYRESSQLVRQMPHITEDEQLGDLHRTPRRSKHLTMPSRTFRSPRIEPELEPLPDPSERFAQILEHNLQVSPEDYPPPKHGVCPGARKRIEPRGNLGDYQVDMHRHRQTLEAVKEGRLNEFRDEQQFHDIADQADLRFDYEGGLMDVSPPQDPEFTRNYYPDIVHATDTLIDAFKAYEIADHAKYYLENLKLPPTPPSISSRTPPASVSQTPPSSSRAQSPCPRGTAPVPTVTCPGAASKRKSTSRKPLKETRSSLLRKEKVAKQQQAEKEAKLKKEKAAAARKQKVEAQKRSVVQPRPRRDPESPGPQLMEELQQHQIQFPGFQKGLIVGKRYKKLGPSRDQFRGFEEHPQEQQEPEDFYELGDSYYADLIETEPPEGLDFTPPRSPNYEEMLFGNQFATPPMDDLLDPSLMDRPDEALLMTPPQGHYAGTPEHHRPPCQPCSPPLDEFERLESEMEERQRHEDRYLPEELLEQSEQARQDMIRAMEWEAGGRRVTPSAGRHLERLDRHISREEERAKKRKSRHHYREIERRTQEQERAIEAERVQMEYDRPPSPLVVHSPRTPPMAGPEGPCDPCDFGDDPYFTEVMETPHPGMFESEYMPEELAGYHSPEPLSPHITEGFGPEIFDYQREKEERERYLMDDMQFEMTYPGTPHLLDQEAFTGYHSPPQLSPPPCEPCTPPRRMEQEEMERRMAAERGITESIYQRQRQEIRQMFGPSSSPVSPGPDDSFQARVGGHHIPERFRRGSRNRFRVRDQVGTREFVMELPRKYPRPDLETIREPEPRAAARHQSRIARPGIPTLMHPTQPAPCSNRCGAHERPQSDACPGSSSSRSRLRTPSSSRSRLGATQPQPSSNIQQVSMDEYLRAGPASGSGSAPCSRSGRATGGAQAEREREPRRLVRKVSSYKKTVYRKK